MRSVLVVGLGGVWAEVLRDVRVLPSDLDPDAIVDEIQKLKGAALTRGFRGALPLDLHAMARRRRGGSADWSRRGPKSPRSMSIR